MVGTGNRVVVAMSGGVDSSVAACLLHEQGYDVTGLFMRMGAVTADEDEACPPRSDTPRHRGCCSAIDASDARAVAGRLGIPFFALNFSAQFDRIIDYFAEEYVRGRTPNPCVMCNESLKFGRLADYGRASGADYLATGHHARVERADGDVRLRRGADAKKDQSYVLFGIGRDRLARTLLPIGELSKEEVRQHARRFGLPVHDKAESQDICFVPDRDYARVVRERRPESSAPGAIVDADGRAVGRHEGIAGFTVGQRRGLGVAMGLPIYVTAVDAGSNRVEVGPREALARRGLLTSRVRWLIDTPKEPFRSHVKIRYAHQAALATVTPLGADAIRVRFDEPQYAVTPGQAAVCYDGDIVLGGGWIDASEE
jgi:tRNA-specific 2-thiouridylase